MILKDSFDFGEDIRDAEELKRLLAAEQSAKSAVGVSLFFETLEKYFRSYIDRDAAFPRFSLPYVYVCEEGLIIVLAVVYSLMRLQSKRLSVTQTVKDDVLLLSFSAEDLTESDVSAVASEEMLACLSMLAKTSGFSLAFGEEGKPCATLSLLPFHAIPVVTYSCSETLMQSAIERAFRIFFALEHK